MEDEVEPVGVGGAIAGCGPYLVADILVTPDMIVAGRAAHGGTSEEWLPRVYRAMHALAPVELVSEGERQAVRERDEARDHVQLLQEAVENQSVMLRTALAKIAAKGARIAELKTILAEKAKAETASDMKPPPPPKDLPANALAGSKSDPRRIGG